MSANFSCNLIRCVAVLALVTGSVGSLQADAVVPNANTDSIGDTNNRFPFLVSGGMRYQQVYNSSEFGSTPPGGEAITALFFRPDLAARGPFSKGINGVTVRLSTITAAADGLSTTFADNIGADVTTVFEGSLTLSSANTQGPGNTRAFDIAIHFDTPFFYDPSKGNLLVDILNADPSNNTISFFFDAVGPMGDSVSRVVGDRGSPLATAGIQDSAGLITKFSAVPGGPTVIAPDSFIVTRGDFVSGGLTELANSDNMDLTLRRRNSDLQSRTEFEVKSTSPTDAPTSFEFTFDYLSGFTTEPGPFGPGLPTGRVFATSGTGGDLFGFNFISSV